MNVLTLIIVGLVGIVAGGLVNVLADDLPRPRSPRLPHYPDDSARPLVAWMGLTAFLSGKRASPGGARLSWRYPIVEIATALLMMLAVAATSDGDPKVSDLQLLFWLVYMAIFVLITVIDIEHKLILFAVIIPSAVLAIADAVLTPTSQGPDLGAALIGAALGFGTFYLMHKGGFLFTYIMGKTRGQEITTTAFGFGDVMMATLSGLILGWGALIFAMFITVFLGALGAILYLLSRSLFGSKYSMFTALPYGPYIVTGTLLMLLFRSEIGAVLGYGG